MSEVTINYGTVAGHDHFSQRVESDRLVDEIERIKRQFQDALDAPYGVDVENHKGDTMTVGYDLREGFLMFQPASDRERGRISLGDENRQDTKVFYLPQWTELDAKYMLPTSKVLDALRSWADRGEFSDEISWTTEPF